MSATSYRIGHAMGSKPLLVGLALAVFVVIAYFNYQRAEQVRAQEAAQAAAKAASAASARAIRQAEEAEDERKRLIALKESCADKGALRREADAHMRAGKAQSAFEVLAPCRPVLDDFPLTKATFIRALDAARKNDEAEAKRALAAEKAAKKAQGVRIGMSQEDVLASSWGRPEKVNRTTTASGTREQWVYGSGNYLYFQNGVLTSIQN